jgi:hypothetical protein
LLQFEIRCHQLTLLRYDARICATQQDE